MILFIGILGSILCILALAITLYNGKFGESSYYKLLNLVGGSLLLYYAIAINSLPFIILEGIWVLLPAISLIKIYKNSDLNKK
jgi:hypothetical protein